MSGKGPNKAEGRFSCLAAERTSETAAMPSDPLTDSLRALVAQAVDDTVGRAVEDAIARALPEVVRRAALPQYLTRQGVIDLTGWSARHLSNLQSQRRIPYHKRGRTVLFKTSDVEAYLAEGRVPAKRRGGEQTVTS